MNSQNVIKKTLPLIIIILIIIGVAVTCTAVKRDKSNPVISKAEEIYMSATEGDYKYSITRGKAYEELKANVGLSTLINLLNVDLLTKEGSYGKVTDEEINAEIEKAAYPDGKEGLTDDEIAEALEEYYHEMLDHYGLRTEQEVKDYHRLVLAKKAYAKSQLDKEISEKDAKAESESEKYFTDTDYANYYNENYQKEFWAIVVPFTTEAQAKNALNQLGISLHSSSSDVADDFNYWYWTETEEVLTPAEVVQAMIDMYNTVYAYKCKDYPTDRILVKKDLQYTIDEFGNYVFNTTFDSENEDKNTFHYTYKELSDYQTSILNSMKNTWVMYNENSKVEANAKWYTPVVQSYNSGALYCYVLKIAEQDPVEMDSVTDEITNALVEAKLTTTYIETQMAKLREDSGLVIYDVDLENNYISSMANYSVTHKATKKSSSDLIAKTDDKEYKVDDLFNEMDYKYGVSIGLSLMNHERFLGNTDLNKYYDYKSDAKKEKDKWIDRDKYNELKEQLANEKLVFTSGTYAQYGYSPADYTWLEFIKEIYGAEDENDLLVEYLYSFLISEYQKKLADVSEIEESSDLWDYYQRNMQPIADEYFSVSGVHTLICIYSDPASTTPTDPSEWTELQVQYAKELQEEILKYIDNNEGTVQDKMQALVDGYKQCLKYDPRYELNEESQPKVTDANYSFGGIEVAKYRSVGLSIKYEDLGEFTNGKMVSEFDAAVKSVYDLNPESESMTLYRNELKTVYGYHVYANLTCKKIATYTVSGEEKVLPTLAIVKTYLKDSSDESITSEMKTAITTYFSPIQTELSGNYNTYINEYKDLKALTFDLSGTQYDRELLDETIDHSLEEWQGNLKYTK